MHQVDSNLSAAGAEDNFSGSLRRVGEVLAGAKRVALLSHTRPDGDALGSVIALGAALETIVDEVIIVNEDGVPDSLAFLPGSERVKTPDQFPDGLDVDVLAILDTGSFERAGKIALGLFQTEHQVVNIDHHASNPGYGDVALIDTSSPATGQIVYQLIREMGWPLDEVSRDNLFVAISTDTGSFRYPATTAETFRIGADLVAAGTDVGRISQLLYESYPERRIRLIRELLQDLELRHDGRLAILRLSRELYERLQLEDSDTDSILDLVRSVDTVEVALFFEELPDGRIRISARSKNSLIDVGQICSSFGGGGHTLAAGARMAGPLDDAVEKFSTVLNDKFHG